MADFACLYFGRADECPECGFFNETGHRYCSHECADRAAARAAANEADVQARRAREDAFAAAVAELIAAGHTYEEADVLLASMPT